MPAAGTPGAPYAKTQPSKTFLWLTFLFVLCGKCVVDEGFHDCFVQRVELTLNVENICFGVSDRARPDESTLALSHSHVLRFSLRTLRLCEKCLGVYPLAF